MSRRSQTLHATLAKQQARRLGTSETLPGLGDIRWSWCVAKVMFFGISGSHYAKRMLHRRGTQNTCATNRECEPRSPKRTCAGRKSSAPGRTSEGVYHSGQLSPRGDRTPIPVGPSRLGQMANSPEDACASTRIRKDTDYYQRVPKNESKVKEIRYNTVTEEMYCVGGCPGLALIVFRLGFTGLS